VLFATSKRAILASYSFSSFAILFPITFIAVLTSVWRISLLDGNNLQHLSMVIRTGVRRS
jgi:hypothetical protein